MPSEWYVVEILSVNLRLGKPSRDIPHIPITPTPLLCAELVRDNEENYISVTQDHLDTYVVCCL